MKKLIAIPAGIRIDYDLSADEVIKTEIKNTDNTFTIIARCGLMIEDYFLHQGRTMFYSNLAQYPIAGIIWKTPTDEFVDTSISWIQTIRGDELLFPSLNFNYDSSWVVGNPRALVKWAACCVNLNISSIDPSHGTVNSSDQVRLVWLAHRLGLKIYGQKET